MHLQARFGNKMSPRQSQPLKQRSTLYSSSMHRADTAPSVYIKQAVGSGPARLKSRQNSEGICTPSPLSARTFSAGPLWVHWASSCQLLPRGPLLFHWHFGLSNQKKSRFMDWALKFVLGTTETCKTVYPIKKSRLEEAKISSWLFLEDVLVLSPYWYS